MTPHQRGIRQRRQVFGVVLIIAAVVVLLVALWSRARFLSYAALVAAGVGAWMLSRRT